MSQALDTVLAPAKEAFSSPLFTRVRSHLYSQLLCMGRHTITGLLSTQGRVHQDWSADYRLYANRRLDPQVLFDCVKAELRSGRKEREPLVLALDDSLLRKRGPRAHGVKWLRDPLGPPFSVNFVRGQRVVQFSAALQNGPAQARMVPVDFQHAPAPPKVPAQAGPQERAAIEARHKEENINAVAARRLKHLAAQERCPVVAVCDGRFPARLRPVGKGRVFKAKGQETPGSGPLRLMEAVMEDGGGSGSGGLVIELPGGGRVRVDSPLQLRLAAELLTMMAQSSNRGRC